MFRWSPVVTGSSMFAVLVLMVLSSASATRGVDAQVPLGSFAARPTFTSSGLASVVFHGGTVDQLATAAVAAGASGVWAQDQTGAFHLLVLGGPAFLQDAFKASFPSVLGLTAVTLAAAPGRSGTATPAAAPQRAIVDRPDDVAGYQIHVMYVLPRDGTDEQLDVDGRITTSVLAFQRWISDQTGGLRLRIDTSDGVPDVTFHRLKATDSEISASGLFVRDRIEAELVAAGYRNPQKLYAVYYGGTSSVTCGGGAWPPTLSGNVAAMYLRGLPPGAPPCATNPLGASVEKPGYIDLSMPHEILHTIGLVPSCAPHFTAAGHVSDSPRDLMYAGSLPWQPSELDVGRDDYFKHGRAGCLDLANSVFIEPAAPDAVVPPSWPPYR